MIKILLTIICSFGKIGLISLGGGNSILKLLEHEAVSCRHWVGQEEFITMVSSSFLFPGLTAVKLSALIGYKTAGFWGLIFAVLSLNLPGLLITLIGYQWLSHSNSPALRKIMIGVQYGALALLAAASYSLAQGIVGLYFSNSVVLCCFLFFLALTFCNLSPFYGFIAFIAVCFFLVT